MDVLFLIVQMIWTPYLHHFLVRHGQDEMCQILDDHLCPYQYHLSSLFRTRHVCRGRILFCLVSILGCNQNLRLFAAVEVLGYHVHLLKISSFYNTHQFMMPYSFRYAQFHCLP